MQPDGALQAHTIRLPLWGLRLALGAMTAVVGLLVFVALSYAPLVRAASRVPLLERKVARLEQDNARIRELAAALDSVERRYEQVRGMIGGDVMPIAHARVLHAAPGATGAREHPVLAALSLGRLGAGVLAARRSQLHDARPLGR